MDFCIWDVPKLEKLHDLNRSISEIDKKQTTPAVCLPLNFSRKVLKDEDKENGIVDFLLQKKPTCYFKKMPTNIGHPHFESSCRNCLSFYSTDNEPKKHQIV